jgi:hypothetical protein
LEKHLHIISLTVPYPVDYGGVYDLFYKLPALQRAGVQVHLHCFDYGRGHQPELNKYCQSVNYYTRTTGIKALQGKLPYITASRKNEELFNTLLQDNYPILAEGIHCTALFLDSRFANRRKFIRLHNVEYEYYKSLFAASANPLKKLYYRRETMLLKNYEATVAQQASGIFTVTQRDADVYKTSLGCTITQYLPLFLPAEWVVNSAPGMGAYCLYHGDLSVEMNNKAATWLVKKIFSRTDVPLVIAGKNPPTLLKKLCHKNTNTCLVANPSQVAMQDMIAKAHVNILPSFSHTGIKIKLLNALYNGRHCLVTPPTVAATGLESLCHIADDEKTMYKMVAALHRLPFTETDVQQRSAVLAKMDNNQSNAEKIIAAIWG